MNATVVKKCVKCPHPLDEHYTTTVVIRNEPFPHARVCNIGGCNCGGRIGAKR